MHLVDDGVFRLAAAELRRVLARGAKVVVIENQVGAMSWHNVSRPPRAYAEALGCRSWRTENAQLPGSDRPMHAVIVGSA